MGWKGLKVKHMPALMPVDISGIDENDRNTDAQHDTAVS